MARVSKAQSVANRQTILDESARLFRERGMGGVSVADLMGAAGLTHGGFYGHFDSKDDLAGQACAQAFAQSVERWEKRVADAGPGHGVDALTAAYLSARTRDNPGTSCPAPAWLADVAREPKNAPVRGAYVDGVKRLLAILGSAQRADGSFTSDRRTMAQFATLIGALALARATAGDPISDTFLDSAREMLSP